MTTNDYLKQVLASQTLAKDSDEMTAVEEHRERVEELITTAFPDAAPTIRYGGSKAKGTMIREAYDLDVICYFPRDDSDAGGTLKDIFTNVRDALSDEFVVEEKSSALRLRGKAVNVMHVDFHVDVVPGRFVDDSKSDAFLYQSSGKKERLKTNLDIHLSHVRDSGVRDAIRLMKLWRVRNGVRIRTFVLELLVIDLLKSKKHKPLEDQLLHVWTSLKQSSDSLSVEDPANPTGNDLSVEFGDPVRSLLASVATATLSTLELLGWEAVFGKVADGDDGVNKSAAITEGDRRYKTEVIAGLSNRRDGSVNERYPSDGRALPRGWWLRFEVVRCDVPEPYEIRWVVENHGHEAERARDMGHTIYPGSRHQWETTKFVGQHYMYCDIIKDGVHVARTRHVVNIR